jgi:hypothetical protein
MVAWIYINLFFFLLFQTLEETITVIVPQNAKNVYDSKTTINFLSSTQKEYIYKKWLPFETVLGV